MSRRVSLREFQEGLAGRLKAAATEAAPSARLGFEAGGEHWLLKLEGSGEVLPVPAIQTVPLTRPWYLGVANVRGVLYSVSDFGAFLGAGATPRGPQNRMLLVGQPHSVNCALLVSRLAGLRSIAELTPEPMDELAAGRALASWRDKEGRLWRELDVERLIAAEDFLDIAVH